MTAKLYEILKDILMVNSIIAMEALQITENTSKIARNSSEVPPQCVESHGKLRNQVIDILNKHFEKKNIDNLSDHVLGH